MGQILAGEPFTDGIAWIDFFRAHAASRLSLPNVPTALMLHVLIPRQAEPAPRYIVSDDGGACRREITAESMYGQ